MLPTRSLLFLIGWLCAAFTLAAEPAPTAKPGTLRVAVYEQFPPYSHEGRGIDVDLASALARRLGLALELAWFQSGEEVSDDLRNMVWKGHYLGTRRADLLLHVPLDPALQRSNDKVKIFGAYHRESMALASDSMRLPRLDPARVLEAQTWAGAAIGVALDSWADTHLLRTLGAQSPHAIKHFRDNAQALEALRRGEVAAVLAPRSEIEGLLPRDSRFHIAPYRIPPPAPSSWTLGMAVASEKAGLAAAIEAALGELRADGTLARIFARHGVSAAGAPRPTRAWVPNEKSGSLSLLDVDQATVLTELAVGGRPRGIALDRRSEKLFVSDAQFHRLRLFDAKDGRLLKEAATGNSPEGVQVSPDGLLVAVAVEESNSVRLYETATLNLAGEITVRGSNPEHLAFSPDGLWLAVSAEEAEQVDLIDLTARRTVGQITVGRRPRGLAFSPDGKRLFVACELAGKLYVVDFPERRVLAALDAGHFSNGVALTPDGSRVFVSNGKDASVSVYDTGKLARLADIRVGERPWNMAITEDGRRLLVANGRSNSVSVIDVSGLRVVDEIAVGAAPWGVAIQ